MTGYFKGNIHCHTVNSDGGATPADLARFYKNAGYDFISITDHNHLTSQSETGYSGEEFLVIPGCEYTAVLKLSEESPAIHTHVNGVGISQNFQFEKCPPHGKKEIKPTKNRVFYIKTGTITVEESLQFAVSEINSQGGFATMNHPNWRWSFGANEMKNIKNADAFEIWNGSYDANNEGTPNRPSMDEIWDSLLSDGKRIWAVAADDCHFLPDPQKPTVYPPCSAWVHVEAEELTEKEIIRALKEGRFYSSTGIELLSQSFGPERIELCIKPFANLEYYTTFIGNKGEILAVKDGLNPSYDIKGDEVYIRSRINCSGLERAWLQPLFLNPD